MHRPLFATSLLAVSGLLATPVLAQSAEPSVAGYLCQFANQCGDEPAEEEELTREAPATKGFRIARPQAQASQEAPSVKGFRVARPDARRAPKAPAIASVSPRGARPAVAPRTVAASRADLMVAFNVGSAELTSVGRRNVGIFAQALKTAALSGKQFLIAGHTDSSGDRAANLELSERRAQAVADSLVAAGVDRSRLQVKGFGPDQPLPGRRASDPVNRRVEAEIL